MSKFLASFAKARRAASLTQQQLAERAGLARMAVQKLEAGSVDPKLSTLEVAARSLGMELMLVPAALRPELEAFVQSGGKLVGQPAGVAGPKSIVDVVAP
jgi:transcriptional regulator with XRE-family HTH domain